MPYGYRQIHGSEGLGSISGVVSSLPVGFALGEERIDNGLTYRLFYNAGNSQVVPGKLLSPQGVGGGGPYSVTVTYATGTPADLGACVVHNATATTGTYFWGVKQGYLASGLISSGTTLQTGYVVLMGTDGAAEGAAYLSTGVTGGVARFIGVVSNGPSAGTVTVRQASVYVRLP